MCGIAGILRVWPPDQRDLALRTPPAHAIPEPWLDILDDSIKHRGPDGHGRFRDRALRPDGCIVDVALVHRRLSIIDHAGGHQPMVLRIPRHPGAPSESSGATSRIPGHLLTTEEVASHTRRLTDPAPWLANPDLALASLSNSGTTDHIAVVFNGCIYNHRELRKELEAAGHVFGTDHSDTEVLVHGWREWGEGLWARLQGMYAVVLWDASQMVWRCRRDRAGEKPLYVLGTDTLDVEGSMAFVASSAAAAIRGYRAFSADSGGEWDVELTIAHYSSWAQYGASGAAHLLHGLGEYLPASAAFGRNASDPLPARTSTSVSPSHVEVALSQSVVSCLEADVPIGVFLSGGVDSSLIALMAQRGRGNVKTFSVRMPDPRFDESQFARAVADRIGSEHQELSTDPHPAEDLLKLIEQLGLPFGDSSLLPAHWVSRAARQHVRVALGGDGGDELFGGYERHVAAHWLRHWRGLLRYIPSGLGSDAHPKSLLSKLGRLGNAAIFGYHQFTAIFPEQDFARLLGRPFPKWTSAFEIPEDPLRFDFESYLPNDLLRKTDTASMSVALEVRAPFLTKQMIDLAFQAPLSSLMPHHQRKGLLRQVARKYLPAEIVDRPKMGFAIPIGDWFRSDYGGLRTMLLDHLNSTEPFGPPSLGIDLNMAFIRQMLDEHLGTGPSGIVKRDHGQRLYMLLVLSIWSKWLGGLASEPPRVRIEPLA